MMRRRPAKTAAAITLATAALVSGCSSSQQAQVVAMATAVPSSTPSADPAAQTQVVAGIDGFGLTLLRKVGAGNNDLVIAPQSLAQALTMLLPGTRGSSASELESVLGFTGIDPTRAAYAVGAQDLATRQRAVAGSDTLTQSDDVWSQKGLALQSSYLQTLSGAFGTGVYQPDFTADPAGVADQINQQVSQDTHGLIPQLFDPSSFDKSTELVLTDATYFKAPWQQSFDPGQTAPADFTAAGGSTESVPMMNQTSEFGYASGPGWKAVQLPYGGGQLAMDVLLPDSGAPGALAAYRNSLTVSGLTAMADSFKQVPVELSLPKFTIDSSEPDLADVLAAMGTPDLFTPAADLDGVFAKPQVPSPYVKAVVQKAHIEVGESGTTAAAGSGVVGEAASAAEPSNQVVFDADHPFVYVVRDVISGQILFLGQVSDPR